MICKTTTEVEPPEFQFRLVLKEQIYGLELTIQCILRFLTHVQKMKMTPLQQEQILITQK